METIVAEVSKNGTLKVRNISEREVAEFVGRFPSFHFLLLSISTDLGA